MIQTKYLMKQKINSTSEPGYPNIEVKFNRPIELFVDNFIGYDPYKNTFKIFWFRESEVIGKLTSEIIANKDKFDAIITCQEEVLQKCDNAYFMEFGTAWVFDYDIKTEKKFQISHLTGFKEITEGHKLRKKIHYKQNKITNPKDFYISHYGGVIETFDNKQLQETKTPMFNSQFHICIENTKENNYFTEKLIDCLITKTIPIYWGCPNIEKFFDINGFFIAENEKNIIEICNSINENTYQNKILSIEKNFELSQKYITILDRLEIVINRILNTNQKTL